MNQKKLLNFEMEVREVLSSEVQDVISYINRYRIELYPMLSKLPIPNDIEFFKETYIDKKEAVFLIAIIHGNIVGTIGCVPYDNRFPFLNYTNKKTTEIVRLYVDPAFRRKGIGQKLVDTLFSIVINDFSYKVLYLHTHPFLRGALEFWEKNGFIISEIIKDPVMEVIHMEKIIRCK